MLIEKIGKKNSKVDSGKGSEEMARGKNERPDCAGIEDQWRDRN